MPAPPTGYIAAPADGFFPCFADPSDVLPGKYTTALPTPLLCCTWLPVDTEFGG